MEPGQRRIVGEHQRRRSEPGDGFVGALRKLFLHAGNRRDVTDGCCDLYQSRVDDVTYFDAMLDDISAKNNVDKKRVFVVGHSNGGFMAHRLACDLSPAVEAIVSLAGAQWLDVTMCQPTRLNSANSGIASSPPSPNRTKAVTPPSSS